MLAAYLNSLHEAVNRRMALVTFGIAVVVAVTFNWVVHLKPIGDDYMVVFGNRPLGPASLAVPSLFTSEAQFTGFFWLLLGVLAAVPLFASALEKGWTELTLSKGTARWRIMMGRYFGGISIYFVTLAVASVPLALRLWVQTGISPKPLFIALLLQTVGFAALIALAMLPCVAQLSSAVGMVLAIIVTVVSPYLYRRTDTFYQVFTSHWSRGIVDWMYRILPKNSELDGLSTSFIMDGHLGSWWPIWSTMLFTVALLAGSLYYLRRKSF
jgi:ABC-type transport system involved in multi-copper enzyme maturation permease subunit